MGSRFACLADVARMTRTPSANATERRPLVAGVGISHPERVLVPAAGVTKLGLARYYERIGEWILPHLEDRPLTLVRCPGGVGGADCFYMKHSKVWSPAPVRRVNIREKTKVDAMVRRQPDRFTALTVPGRLARRTRDPWHEYWTTKQTIPRGAIDALQRR
jgi:DNA primase